MKVRLAIDLLTIHVQFIGLLLNFNATFALSLAGFSDLCEVRCTKAYLLV